MSWAFSVVIGFLTMHAPRGGEVQENVSQSVVFAVFFPQAQDAIAENGCDFVEAFGCGHAVGMEGIWHQSLSSEIKLSRARLLSDIYREKF
jgi:hypothetical protein